MIFSWMGRDFEFERDALIDWNRHGEDILTCVQRRGKLAVTLRQDRETCDRRIETGIYAKGSAYVEDPMEGLIWSSSCAVSNTRLRMSADNRDIGAHVLRIFAHCLRS